MPGHEETLERLEEAREELCETPGVKEIMEVYGAWAQLESATQAYQQAMGVRTVVSFSNSSTPTRRSRG